MAISIALTASCAAGGETKELSSTATLDAAAVTTGTQTVGNTYEVFATAYGGSATVIVYNTGTVDASIRVTLSSSATNDFHCINCIAGGVVVIPYAWGDGNNRWTALHARSASGTVTLDYCIIR